MICLGGSWGKVCGEFSSRLNAAVVVCRQLGLSTEGKIIITSDSLIDPCLQVQVLTALQCIQC